MTKTTTRIADYLTALGYTKLSGHIDLNDSTKNDEISSYNKGAVLIEVFCFASCDRFIASINSIDEQHSKIKHASRIETDTASALYRKLVVAVTKIETRVARERNAH